MSESETSESTLAEQVILAMLHLNTVAFEVDRLHALLRKEQNEARRNYGIYKPFAECPSGSLWRAALQEQTRLRRLYNV